MGYIDLIPDVFRLTMPDLATGKSYRTKKFNIGNKQCIGVTIKASQALSVAVAYGIATDAPAAAGVDIAASLPYKTSATSFESNTSTEGGTYHEIALPPHARQAQLVISNASGSTVSGAVIDAALRVVSYPSNASDGGGSTAFGDITGWPGVSTDFVRGNGSYSPLSASDITAAGGLLSPLNAIDMIAGQAVLTSGTSSAYTVADSRIPTTAGVPTNGQLLFVRWHTLNSSGCTLALNGGTAYQIFDPRLVGNIGASRFTAGDVAILAYCAQFGGWRLLSTIPLASVDLPTHTHSAGDLTSGTLALARLPTRPRWVAPLTGTNTVSTTEIILPWGTPTENTLGASYAAGVITLPYAGPYLVECAVAKAASSITCSLVPYIGSTAQDRSQTTTLQNLPHLCATIVVAAGGTTKIGAIATAGGSGDLDLTIASGINSQLKITYLG